MFRRFLPEVRRQHPDRAKGLSAHDYMEELMKGTMGLSPLTEWQTDFPSLDISENDREVRITAELPGMKPEDIEVTIRDGVLTLKGEKKFKDEEKRGDYHRIERSYGSFTRSVRLPSAVDEDRVKAGYRDGVLTLEMPKAEEAGARRIKIES